MLMKRGFPNVLKSVGSYYDEKEEVYRFSTELKKMNLAQFVRQKGTLTIEKFVPIFDDILSG